MRRFASILSFLSFSALLACGDGGGGGGGPTGPTAPPPPASQLLINLALVSLNGGLEEAILSFDNREVARPVCNPAGVCQMTATITGASRGNHTVSVTVVRQNRQSVTYQAVGQADFVDSGGSRSVPLQQRQVTLRVGQSVVYEISI
jgi:hypothetical protein